MKKLTSRELLAELQRRTGTKRADTLCDWTEAKNMPSYMREQVSDEVIEQYQITPGDFDTITGCKYKVPSFQDIGRLYSIMIEDCARPGEEMDELMKLFCSFISDEISRFDTDLYYQNPSYLECSYQEGYLLD